jgi:two-component system, OmpR family, osmolarity sensor histidine kinase EnvZ
VSLPPRTLFGRNVALMIALIALTEGAAALVYRQYVQNPRIVQLAALTVLYVDAVHAALSSASPAERAAFRERLNTSARVRLVSDTQAPSSFAIPRSAPVRLYFSELGERLAANEASRRDVARWLVRPEPAVWVHLAGDDPAWLVFSGERLDAELPWIGFAWLLLTAGTALAGAFLIQRRLNRPLADLTRAAEQVGKGEPPSPLPETGPAEIAAVARSFNRMSESLQRAERERALMLAGVSHDLRTPLTKLRLAAAMLDDGGNADLHQSMTRNIEEIDAIIGQFLDYARAGESETPEVADLALLLTDVAGEFAARGFPVAQKLEPLPSFAFRPVAMHRAVVNLLENAVRHAGTGLELQSRFEGDRVRVSVLDRGPGIPAAQADAVKQPFVRLERDSSQPGAGLGLAIVDRIVRLHGGVLDLSPRDGGGLEARISLPVPTRNDRGATGSPATPDREAAPPRP